MGTGNRHQGTGTLSRDTERMRLFTGRIVLISLMLVLSLAFVETPCGDTIPFHVYDALLYLGKPDLEAFGLKPIRVVYESELWMPKENTRFADRHRVAAVARRIRDGSLVCIDIEVWPLTGKDEVVRESIEKFKSVANWLRQGTKNATIGYYGILPMRDYWRAISGKSTYVHRQWIHENKAVEGIAETIDVVFPSLYTFYPDQKEWEKYAIENIKAARMYGKPVYAFLWPMYHDSTNRKGQYISQEYWRFQLEVCRKYADGVVIWGGWKERWDDNAPWWIETKRFLSGE
jgi:hypothetical protein